MVAKRFRRAMLHPLGNGSEAPPVAAGVRQRPARPATAARGSLRRSPSLTRSVHPERYTRNIRPRLVHWTEPYCV